MMSIQAYRKSDQREAIIAAIRKLGGHSTADQVYDRGSDIEFA